MTTAERPRADTVAWAEERVAIAGAEVALLKAGSGRPLFLLPKDNGHAPGREFAGLLSAHYTVYLPFYPGYHGSPDTAAWEWLYNVRDVAVIERQVVDALGLDGLILAGTGYGGWIAAEMASMSSKGLAALVLVAPMGIKPESGFIHDQFLSGTEAYARAGFEDTAGFEAAYGTEVEYDQLDAWETDRQMTSRIGWKPYMYNPALPRLLGSVDVPALVITGDADKIVPPVCASQYAAALPNATLETMPGCNHAVDVEHAGALAASVTSFLQRTLGA